MSVAWDEFEAWLDLFPRIGQRVPAWTQGRGGNLSIKVDGALWVKATGLRLDEVHDRAQLARLELPGFVTRLDEIESASADSVAAERRYADLLRAARDPRFAQPSMETAFHATLPAPWVLHFHSLPAVLLAQKHFHGEDARQIEGLFARHRLTSAWIDHAVPGRELAMATARSPDADAFVVRNHGVILQGRGADVLDRWEALSREACREFGWHGLVDAPDDGDDAFPLRIYFPDTAVFVNDIRRVLRPVAQQAGFFRIPAGGETNVKDRDFIEIAQATRALYRACPELDEIPAELAARVSGLPTEDIRRAVAGELP